MSSRRKRPRDPSQLAKMIVDIASGEINDTQPARESGISPASQFARAGGLKGGKARAEKLTAKERSKIAAAAARARWGKPGRGGDGDA